jgi:hypothetical protein
MTMSLMLSLVLALLLAAPYCSSALIPLIDGGKDIPVLYNGYFNEQIAKQAASAVQNAVAAGKKKIEVNFPPVPNLEEVRFGTPLNQRFGKTVVARDLAVPGGYFPGSDIARQQVAFANMYWAKKISSALGGGLLGGKRVHVLSAEPVTPSLIKNRGSMSTIKPLSLSRSSKDQSTTKGGAVIMVNPGGEETWERLRNAYGADRCMILNNAYSTTYGLGNKANYEEAYYLKRISRGWVFRKFPDPWKAYLEKPDGSVELLQTYQTKPELSEVAKLVREESFRRYAINNDRWMTGRM